MALAYVENGIAVRYCGITVYHTYKNDFFEQPPRKYRFTLEPFGAEDDTNTFDIRDMSGYCPALSPAANLVQMIDAGGLEDTREKPESDTTESDPYCTANTIADICPVCGAMIQDYGVFEVHDNQIEYPFTCSSCQVSGSQWGAIVFNGYTL